MLRPHIPEAYRWIILWLLIALLLLIAQAALSPPTAMMIAIS